MEAFCTNSLLHASQIASSMIEASSRDFTAMNRIIAKVVNKLSSLMRSSSANELLWRPVFSLCAYEGATGVGPMVTDMEPVNVPLLACTMAVPLPLDGAVNKPLLLSLPIPLVSFQVQLG